MTDTHRTAPGKSKNPTSFKTWKLDLVLILLLAVITALYALLMLTETVPVWGWAALAGLWLIYALLNGRLTVATPLDFPILAILVLSVLSLSFNIDRALALPQVRGLALSIALYYVIVNLVRNYRYLLLAIIALVCLALGTVLLGVMGAAELQAWVAPISGIMASWLGGASVNANTLGGALSFFVPLLVALLWDDGAFYRKYLRRKASPSKHVLAYKSFVALALLLALVMLILTQSRSAYLGTAVGISLFIFWKDRKFLWLIPVVLAFFLFMWLVLAQGSLPNLFEMLDPGGEATLPDRFALWRDTLGVIQDFPFSGVGMSAFERVYRDYYTYTPFSRGVKTFFHPHNTYLAVAVEQGLPVLVLFAALISGGGWMVRRSYKVVRSIGKTLLVGLAAGVAAHLVYGLLDAYVLGKKLGVILWIFLGVIAAVYVHKRDFFWQAGHGQDGLVPAQPHGWPGIRQVWRRTRDMLLGLVLWVGVSLGAAAFVNISALLSVLLAVTGGIGLGWLLAKRFSTTTREVWSP